MSAALLLADPIVICGHRPDFGGLHECARKPAHTENCRCHCGWTWGAEEAIRPMSIAESEAKRSDRRVAQTVNAPDCGSGDAGSSPALLTDLPGVGVDRTASDTVAAALGEHSPESPSGAPAPSAFPLPFLFVAVDF